MSVAYDEEKKTLTYKVNPGSGELEYVLEKGTTDLAQQEVPVEEATGAVQ